MKVQVIAKVLKKFDEETEKWETEEKRIDNVYEIEFDPLNDKYAISDNRELRYLFLNKDCYKLSLKSYKECRKRNLVGA